jgi:hypothetical protein
MAFIYLISFVVPQAGRFTVETRPELKALYETRVLPPGIKNLQTPTNRRMKAFLEAHPELREGWPHPSLGGEVGAAGTRPYSASTSTAKWIS